MYFSEVPAGMMLSDYPDPPDNLQEEAEQYLRDNPQEVSAVVAGYHYDLAILAGRSGDFDRETEHFEEAERIAARLDHPTLLVRTRRQLFLLAVKGLHTDISDCLRDDWKNELGELIRHRQRALTAAIRRHPDPDQIALVYWEITRAELVLGLIYLGTAIGENPYPQLTSLESFLKTNGFSLDLDQLSPAVWARLVEIGQLADRFRELSLSLNQIVFRYRLSQPVDTKT